MIFSIKCIIFDQDGTLYPSVSSFYLELRSQTKKWLGLKLKLTANQVELLYKKLQKQHSNPFHGFLSLGCQIAEYHKEVFDCLNPYDHLNHDEQLVAFLTALQIPKFIVTMASPLYSQNLQKCLGVSHLITKTYYVSDYGAKYSKKTCYQEIANSLALNYEELCVVGDDFNNDILPAIELGCTAIHLATEPLPGKHQTLSSIYDINLEKR